MLTEKMDPEVKKRWLAALRSGKYKQGQGCLRDLEGNFCCLGVLADSEKAGDWIKKTTDPDSTFSLSDTFYVFRLPSGAYREKTLPVGYAKEVGLHENDAQTRLAYMNDRGKSFAEIADWIEVNL